MRERVKRIFANIEKDLDAILIKNSTEPYIDDNFFYATGLEKGLFEGSIAILYPDESLELIVSELEEELAKKAQANIQVYKGKEDFQNILKSSISPIKTIGLNFSGILHRDARNLKEKYLDLEATVVNVAEGFEKTRQIKDELEISLIKKACSVADTAMQKIPDLLHEGMHEFELAAEIDYLMQKHGADKEAFETISSFGKNTAEPHYTHGDAQLKKGDFVLCDFGARFRKYNSDMTRTFVLGNADEQQKKMYQTVLEAQQAAFDTAKAGIKAHEVHNAAASHIDNTQFAGRFIHSTGHGLGLAVHDGGATLGPGSNIELQDNMVFTIEPGIYIPGFGGVRIEDDVVIKKDGIELLTKTSRELIEI